MGSSSPPPRHTERICSFTHQHAFPGIQSHPCRSWALPELFPRHAVLVDSPPPFGNDVSSGRQNMPSPPPPHPAPVPLPGVNRLQDSKRIPTSFFIFHPPQLGFPSCRTLRASIGADLCLQLSFLCLCSPFPPRPPACIIPAPQLRSPAPHLFSPLRASTSFLSQTLREREREREKKKKRQPPMPKASTKPRHHTIIIWGSST